MARNTPMAAPISARRRWVARNTPPAAISTAMIGSQSPMIWSTLRYDLILPMSLPSTTTKSVCTSGIFAATASPASTSRCFTCATMGATSMATWLFFTCTAPPPEPVSALSTALWARRLAFVQAVSNAELETTLITVWLTSSFRPLLMGPLRLSMRLAAFGGTPFCDAARLSSATRASTSICWSTTLVTRVVTACWTSGSEASGATVAT